MNPNADPTPSKLSEEIQAGVKVRRRITSIGLRIREMYVGDRWKSNEDGVREPIRFNHPYEYIVNMVANLIYSNPRVDCTSDGVNTPESEADQAGLNSLLPQIDFSQTAGLCAVDGMCDFWVGAVILEPTPDLANQVDPIAGSEYVPLRPTLVRIPPSRYVTDASYMGMGEPLFQGHLQIKNKEQMMAEKDDEGNPLYNEDVIKEMTAKADLSDIAKDMLEGCNMDRPPRDEIAFWEVYMPGTRMIYTLGLNGATNWLRDPRPYKGHRKGPYVMGGVHDVPDSLYPLSPLAATLALVEEVNLTADKLAAEIQSAKKIGIVDAALTTAAEQIKNANTGDMLKIPGFVGSMVSVIEVGGPTAVTAQYLLDLLARLDRTSGIGDVIRGSSTGDKTATEVATTDKHADIRTRAIQQKFQTFFVIEVLDRMKDLMHDSPHVCFPVTTDDDNGKKVSRLFLGGPMPGEDSTIRPQINIEANSMSYVPEGIQQAQADLTFQTIQEAAPLIPRMPYVKWRNVLDDMFRARNLKSGADRYFDFDMLQNVIGPAATQPTNPGDEEGPQTSQGQPGVPQGMAASGNRQEQLTKNVLVPNGQAQA